MNKKERKKENKDLERVPFVTVHQTDCNKGLGGIEKRDQLGN